MSTPPFYGDPTLIQPRGHSLTDAIFIPGLSSDAVEIADYSTEAIELRDRERKSYISLGPDGITMTDGTAVMKMSGGKLETTAPSGIAMQTDAQCTVRSQNMDLSGEGNTFRETAAPRTGRSPTRTVWCSAPIRTKACRLAMGRRAAL